MRHTIVPTALTAALALTAQASAATIIDGTTQGWVNEEIGQTLDTAQLAGDLPNYFPAANIASGDPTQSFGPGEAPDLSAAAGILGDWLSVPPSLNTNWVFGSVPGSWAVNSEIAVLYEFTTGTLENVIASIGVDNGVYLWLDGTFIGGEMRSGGAPAGEYDFSLGTLGAGTHYLALILEDHGGATGFNIEVTGDPASEVPVPAAFLLFGSGLAMFARRRRSQAGA